MHRVWFRRKCPARECTSRFRRPGWRYGGQIRVLGGSSSTTKKSKSARRGANRSRSNACGYCLKVARMIDRPVVEGTCRNSGDVCHGGRDERGFPDRGGTGILYVLPCFEQHVRD